jgi:hypothetical protein
VPHRATASPAPTTTVGGRQATGPPVREVRQ